MSVLLRTALLIVGTLSVGLGIIGIFVPILPTTPFLLLGAACYARSSHTFHDWLLSRPYLGPYIRNYRSGRGIPRLTKIMVLFFLWATIIYSVLVVVDVLPIQVILLLIAAVVSAHVLKLPTLPRSG